MNGRCSKKGKIQGKRGIPLEAGGQIWEKNSKSRWQIGRDTPMVITKCSVPVAVPVTRIDGAPDIFAKSGSSVDITCTVTDAATSSLVWWVHWAILLFKVGGKPVQQNQNYFNWFNLILSCNI